MVNDHDDADDIAQMVWIKIWNKLDGFKMASEFSTWLFRIAYNETLNFIAKQKRQGSNTSSTDILDYENTPSHSDAPKSGLKGYLLPIFQLAILGSRQLDQ